MPTDATGVGVQGVSGAVAEGRMASAGMVGNAVGPGRVRYTRGLEALAGWLRNPGA